MFADRAALAKSGRSFDCSTCPKQKQERMRCKEDRWDFTEKDNAQVFPAYVHKGGELYGFCPAKATWDNESVLMFRTLHVAVTTGAMWQDGGIRDQPVWWVELVSWFAQRYDSENFSSKARAVLGDGSQKTQTGVNNDGGVRRPTIR